MALTRVFDILDNYKFKYKDIDENGWIHTGDVGQLMDNKFLQIKDRKKEIFKTSSGKFIMSEYEKLINKIYAYPVEIDKGSERLRVLIDARKVANGLIKLIPITRLRDKNNIKN